MRNKIIIKTNKIIQPNNMLKSVSYTREKYCVMEENPMRFRELVALAQNHWKSVRLIKMYK